MRDAIKPPPCSDPGHRARQHRLATATQCSLPLSNISGLEPRPLLKLAAIISLNFLSVNSSGIVSKVWPWLDPNLN